MDLGMSIPDHLKKRGLKVIVKYRDTLISGVVAEFNHEVAIVCLLYNNVSCSSVYMWQDISLDDDLPNDGRKDKWV